MAELPVPIVTAVCNELRKRGVIDKTRPVRLTDAARAALAADGGHLDPQCPCCAGLGLRIPEDLAALTGELDAAAAGAPQARLELDQTHCTVRHQDPPGAEAAPGGRARWPQDRPAR